MWAMTRSGVSVEYFDSCESCRYVYLDLLWGDDGCNAEPAMVVMMIERTSGALINARVFSLKQEEEQAPECCQK